MLSSKFRLAAFVIAAASVLAAPVSAFADDEGTPEPWTYNQPSQWQYNPGTQDHPTKDPITLNQPGPAGTTVTLATPKLKPGNLNPCVVLKTC